MHDLLINIDIIQSAITIVMLLMTLSLISKVKESFRIIEAEKEMAMLLHIELKQQELECLRDELLELKAKAIKSKFPEMERFYSIEHKMNLFSAKLDEVSRLLIQEGLQQSSDKGRLEYMLKLVNMAFA